MNGNNTEVAILGGGCFWCLEAVFEQLRGVKSVESGYAGGARAEPELQGRLQWRYRPRGGDPRHLRSVGDLVPRTAGSLLRDPRPDDAQPPGERHRHAIPLGHLLPVAGATGHRRGRHRPTPADGTFANPIVTEIASAVPFFKAEDYHQGYYRANPAQGYCQMVVSPKVAKARKAFASKLKG